MNPTDVILSSTKGSQMPIDIKDLDGGVGVIITGQGFVTEKEWVDALVEHLTQDQNKFKKYRYSLSDYTAVTRIEISNEAIYKIAEYCESASKINPEPVIAIAASQDFMYGMARMWELIIDMTDWETMVFRNREDAEDWITEKVKGKYKIDNPKFR